MWQEAHLISYNQHGAEIARFTMDSIDGSPWNMLKAFKGMQDHPQADRYLLIVDGIIRDKGTF